MIENDRTPTPEHLFTWVDVDEYFAALAMSRGWPDWLLEVDAFWDGAELTIEENTSDDVVWAWLASALGPLTVDPARQAIILESADDGGEPLPVSFCRSSELVDPERVPRWRERRIVSQLAYALPQPADPTFVGDVQICAFHSFKGGVGRTLHCVALARELARSSAAGRRKVLLVDADLEAPGITWMSDFPGRPAGFALGDFIALIHGSQAGDISDALQLAKRFLANQEADDDVVVLPARRFPGFIGSPRIEPAHLLTPSRSPYFLTESLAKLAVAVDADVIIVDLRAGGSELNAPVLLDPRVLRVFVTNTDDQSVRGTRLILGEIGRQAPSRRPMDPRCAVLVTQFDERRHDKILFDATAKLMKAVARTNASENTGGNGGFDPVADQVENRPLLSPFDWNLLALPGGWREVCKLIDGRGLGERMKYLVDRLRPPPLFSGAASPTNQTDVVDARRRLRDVARRLVDDQPMPSPEDFLPETVGDLLSVHRTEVPIAGIIGVPGAGKTFIYLRMCAGLTWAGFAPVARVSGVELDAPVVPVFAPSRLSGGAEMLVARAAGASASRLSGPSSRPAAAPELKDMITNSLERDLDETAWRRVWLACMARSAGLAADTDDAEHILAMLAADQKAIFVVDGLEELFPSFTKNPREQQAIRALLYGCARWFHKLRGNPLGMIVFARNDLVFGSDSRIDYLSPFELRWDRADALRLAAWVCNQAGALVVPEDVSLASAGEDMLSQLLVQLWGYRLGPEGSRRARSEDWFITALSDFYRRIQARDIVSFLATAADEALTDLDAKSQWPDRLLTPASMQAALPEVSSKKVELLEIGNPLVSEPLTRLRALPPESGKVPLASDSIELGRADVRLLVDNGVLFREGDRYWVPEIYRRGLGLGHSGILPVRHMLLPRQARGR